MSKRNVIKKENIRQCPVVLVPNDDKKDDFFVIIDLLEGMERIVVTHRGTKKECEMMYPNHSYSRLEDIKNRKIEFEPFLTISKPHNVIYSINGISDIVVSYITNEVGVIIELHGIEENIKGAIVLASKNILTKSFEYHEPNNELEKKKLGVITFIEELEDD